MNRLILIGNGFDLAHGLKTSYNDFLLWYLKRCYNEALMSGQYCDRLFAITRINMHQKLEDNYIESSIDALHKSTRLALLLDSQGFIVTQYGVRNELFRLREASNLLSKLINNCSDANWVDIENEFYKELTRILRKGKDTGRELKILNEALSELIGHLQTYFKQLPVPPKLNSYYDILTSAPKDSDFTEQVLRDVNTTLDQTLLLNFNYTNTVDQYLTQTPLSDDQRGPLLRHIHGKLNDNDNPLVFGFGDELDAAYKEMEQQPLNGFFEYIKSFWYFKTINYRKLVEFIDGANYQVYILGQSCGLSDRTMLSMLFNHPHCISVKIFYHGDDSKNNYTDITHQLGRQFSNKDRMRKVILPSPLCERMPQYDD